VTRIGALYRGDNQCEFCVWAPLRQHVSLRLIGPPARDLPLEKDQAGYWQAVVDDVPPGSRYWYLLDGRARRSDPASQFQPEGVHGPSAVIDHAAFAWTDAGWEGAPLEDMVIYELHVGAFTPQGTFEAVIPRLSQLSELGITAVELMPVAQFPGDRNWGYDGVYPYAVQNLTKQKVMLWHRRHEWGEVAGLMNFDNAPQEVLLPSSQRTWTKVLDSADPKWDGPGAAALTRATGRQRVVMPARSIIVFHAGAAVMTEQKAAKAAVAVTEE
jgi:hypothetical protein